MVGGVHIPDCLVVFLFGGNPRIKTPLLKEVGDADRQINYLTGVTYKLAIRCIKYQISTINLAP
jgi:hypothetical protein